MISEIEAGTGEQSEVERLRAELARAQAEIEKLRAQLAKCAPAIALVRKLQMNESGRGDEFMATFRALRTVALPPESDR